MYFGQNTDTALEGQCWEERREDGRREGNKEDKIFTECLLCTSLKTPRGGRFTKEEIGAERLSNSSEVSQLVHGLNMGISDLWLRAFHDT